MSWRAVGTLALIAWGALAFGAVYPWAYTPLFAGCAILSLCTWRARERTATDASLLASLVILGTAIALQLVPAPVSLIRWISPETDRFLQRYAMRYAAGSSAHALSIDPAATALALAAIVVLACLLIGLAAAMTRHDSLHIARGITAIGVALAFIGIIQKATWNGMILGFWFPREGGNPFGPFVNRNHFAGWMLMALPVATGYLCATVARSSRQFKPGWRNRLLWLSSPEASETIAAAFAVAIMALALLLSMSRSGMIGLLAALMIYGWWIVRRRTGGASRTVVAGYLLFVALAAGAWTGFDRIADRFADDESGGLDGRVGIWNDTLQLARRYPLAGIGLNTFGTATLFYQTVSLDKHFDAAHNDYLQLLAEGGILVCVPAVLVIVVFMRTVRRRFADSPPEGTSYWIRIGAVTGIAAIAVQEIVDFSLQIPGNAVLLAVMMALAVRESTARQSVGHPPEIPVHGPAPRLRAIRS